MATSIGTISADAARLRELVEFLNKAFLGGVDETATLDGRTRPTDARLVASLLLGLNTYATEQEGLGKTPENGFFQIVSDVDREYVVLYQVVNGVAEEKKRYPSIELFNAAIEARDRAEAAASSANESALESQESAEASESASQTSIAASEASGIARIFDTRADALAATDLEEGDLVVIVRDEEHDNLVSRSVYENGDLVFKWQPGQRFVSVDGLLYSQQDLAERTLRPEASMVESSNGDDRTLKEWINQLLRPESSQVSAAGLDQTLSAWFSNLASVQATYQNKDRVKAAQVPDRTGKIMLLDSSTPTIWSRSSSEPDVAPSCKFQDGDGRWWVTDVARPTLDMFRSWSPSKSIGYIKSLIASGVGVRIACYGDSTTDGYATTDYSPNRMTNGQADPVAGNESVNSFPYWFQRYLRDMLKGATNVSVWNAGYSGQRLDNGWAYDNYERAVINHFGTPTLTIVAFGLNDIVEAGSQIVDHVVQTRALCQKIMSYGSLPVLMACDPIRRTSITTRDHAEASRQINEAKRAVAADLNIPYLDIESAILSWFEKNNDGYRWREQQPDGLHLTDVGHKFKAAWLSAQFYAGTVFHKQGERFRIYSYDSRANAIQSGDYEASNNAQGGVYTSDKHSSGDELMTAFIWSDSGDAELFYRGLANEFYPSASSYDKGPFTRLYKSVSRTGINRYPAGTGFQEGPSKSSPFKQSDIPYRVAKLECGLNRVSYIAGDQGLCYYGYFEVADSPSGPGFLNALKSTGRYTTYFNSPTKPTIELLPEAIDLSNTFGIMGTDTIDILADLVLPAGTGFVYAWTPGWGDVTTGHALGDVYYNMLYKKSDGVVALYTGSRKAGTVDYQPVSGDIPVSAGDATKVRIRVARSASGGTQTVSVYEGFSSTTELGRASRSRASDQALAFGGTVGGFYIRDNSNITTCEAISVLIRRV